MFLKRVESSAWGKCLSKKIPSGRVVGWLAGLSRHLYQAICTKPSVHERGHAALPSYSTVNVRYKKKSHKVRFDEEACCRIKSHVARPRGPRERLGCMHANRAACTPSSSTPKQGASQQKEVPPSSRAKAFWLDAVILGALRFTGK